MSDLPAPIATALVGTQDEYVCFHTESIDKDFLLTNFNIELKEIVKKFDVVTLKEYS